MAWSIEGTYFENCSCDMVCPCSTSGLVGFPADTLAAGSATRAHVDAFGLTWDTTRKNSFCAPFAWSA